MEIVSKLISIKNEPKDNCGYYGIVLKPKWWPLWVAKLLKNHLEIKEGWLNKHSNRSNWFDYSNGRENVKECYPIYWCKIKSYYQVALIADSPNPFSWTIKDPNGSYNIAE